MKLIAKSIIMPNQPLVSVTIPVYNSGKYLRETIQSVLSQTYQNFELILINDASTDNSTDIIKSFSDPRIQFYENPVNLGIVGTRNNCLSYAKGKYIAILDGDDISYPFRLEKQVEFLELNPDFGLCGSFYEVINSVGKLTVRIEVPSTASEIRTFLLFNNCFCHSSVTVHRDLLNENKFSKPFELMEDYDLAYRLTAITKLSNLPYYTTRYRVHGKNQSIEKADTMTSLRKKMDARILKDLNIPVTEAELTMHSSFVNSNFEYFKTNAQLNDLETWLIRIYDAIGQKSGYNPDVVARIIVKRWILLFYINKNVSHKVISTRLVSKFGLRYMKYLFEFLADRFRNNFKVS